MADLTLKTDYKDDVLDASKNTRRKYQMIQNEDGTVSFVDVTEYSQVGDSFGSADINATNKAVGELYSDKSHVGMIIHSTTLDTMEKVIALYGGTEWVKIEGMFLLGQSEKYEINSTGGEETHTLTTTEMPAHNHYITTRYSKNGGGASSANRGVADYYNTAWYYEDYTTNSTNWTGDTQAHNNMPPYKTVYICERTK